MIRKYNNFWLLLLLPLFFMAWFFLSKKNDAPLRYLEYFGPKSSLKINDTLYHSIPNFEFTDQNGNKVNAGTIKNKIYVAEYFFTTCKTICPVMNNNLDKIYKNFSSKNDFLILSHTVDPENDSIDVLKHYADMHKVNDQKWLFLTGTKTELYSLARKGYLLSADQGNGGPDDFIHTQNFALIDKERHIRGYYDGTDSIEMERMEQDINLLFKEYEYKQKDK